MRKIIVEPYSDKWREEYNRTKESLVEIMDSNMVGIHHIGSTSVMGLAAKPTIDILIIVKNIEAVDLINNEMEINRFIPKGEAGIKGRRYFCKKLLTDEFVETHHIHVYEEGNSKYEEELLFRDYLRIDTASRDAYAKLKLELSVIYRDSPLKYTNAKSEFIQATLSKARKYFKTNPSMRNQ